MMVGGVSYVSKQSSMTCNMPASFWVLQPQLMHDYLEHEACSYPTGCAIMSGACLMCQADALIRYSELELEGPWHTLPDLLTCLSTQQLSNQENEGAPPDGFVSSLAQMAGKAALGFLKQFVDKNLDQVGH
jgi:hypothetical protein